jgi:hypothetical protein
MSKLAFKRILLGFVFGLIGFITLGIIVGPPTAPTPPAVIAAPAATSEADRDLDQRILVLRGQIDKMTIEVDEKKEACARLRQVATLNEIEANKFINCSNDYSALANRLIEMIERSNTLVRMRHRGR